MDRLLTWIKDHAAKILIVPVALGSMEFVGQLLMAAKDGIISDQELHALIKMASPLQVIAIGVVMYALKKGK